MYSIFVYIQNIKFMKSILVVDITFSEGERSYLIWTVLPHAGHGLTHVLHRKVEDGIWIN